MTIISLFFLSIAFITIPLHFNPISLGIRVLLIALIVFFVNKLNIKTMSKNFLHDLKNKAHYTIIYNIMVTYFLSYIACFIFLVIKTSYYTILTVLDFNLNKEIKFPLHQ